MVFYILDGDKEIGIVESDQREFSFKGDLEFDKESDQEDRLKAQQAATDELAQRLRVLWVDPSKLPQQVNT